MNKILPNLFLGDIESATDLESLTSHNIHHIISILARDEFLVPIKNHILIKLHDGHPYTQTQLKTGVDFIKNAIINNEGILVHCMAGISRSSTLIGAYLMKESKFTPDQAINFIRERREIVDPAYFTFQSAIKWVYPSYRLICTNNGCGKAWDYREKYEFINYALQKEDNENNTPFPMERMPLECTCENPKVTIIS